QVEAVQQRQRQLAPALNHAAEVGGFAEIEAGVQGQRNLHCPMSIGGKSDQVGLFVLHGGGIGGQDRRVYAVPALHFGQVQPVDGAQGIQAVNGRDGAFVFDIRQAAQRDDKLFVLVPLGNTKARLFDVAITKVQSL